MAAPRMNCSFESPINTEHEAGQGANTIILVFGITKPGIEPMHQLCWCLLKQLRLGHSVSYIKLRWLLVFVLVQT